MHPTSDIAARMRQVHLPRGNETIVRHLAERYQISIRAITTLDVGVHRIDRDDGATWVARVFHEERSIERTESDAALVGYLAEVDFPAERLACDNPVSVLDGQSVLVTVFVDGSAPGKGPGAARRLAALLGRLHALPLRDAILPGGALHHVPAYEGLPGREIALAASLLDDIADRLTGDRRRGFEYLREQVASADDCADLPRALAHPDPVLKNVIQKDRVLTIVDWTGAGVGPRMVALAPLLMGAIRPAGWDREALENIGAAYRAHVQLDTSEIERLGSALLIRQLWFAAWNYWTRTVKGNPPNGTEWWMPLPKAIYAPLGRAARSAFLG